MKHTKNQEIMVNTQKGKSNHRNSNRQRLIDKDFKPTIKHLFKELKEIRSRLLKESMKKMYHQIEGIIKKRSLRKTTINYRFKKYSN